MLFLRHQEKTLYGFPSSNRWPNRETKQHNRSIPQSLFELRTEWLGTLLPMPEFTYNNAKNASTGHTPFELNCGFYPRVSFKDDVDPHSRSRFADKLTNELKKLIYICQQNLLYAQEFQKRAYDKSVKPQSYAPAEKVWLNSKYIKTKWNWKLEAKFFGLFQILHLVGKQAYKLDLPTKWKIHDVFDMSMLE